MKKYNYKDLDLYKAAKDLVLSVYALLRKFPREEQYALCDQLRRAVISIPSNLAEGSGRTSAKDQAHFVEIAYGSLMETYSQLQVAVDLGYIETEQMEQNAPVVVELRNKLSALRKSYIVTK